MAVDPLTVLREIALAFPEATERLTWGHPTFRVRDRIFVTYGEDRVDEGGGGGEASEAQQASRPYMTCKTPPGEQQSLLAQGEPFFHPAYVGSKGWIGMRLGPDTDWNEVAELILDSYLAVAPAGLRKGIGVAHGRSRTAQAVLGVGNVIGELIEGKPVRDQQVAVAEVDDDEDSGLRIDFDPDDPSGTTVEL